MKNRAHPALTLASLTDGVVKNLISMWGRAAVPAIRTNVRARNWVRLNLTKGST